MRPKILFILLLITATVAGNRLAAQTYPVQAGLMLQPPYSVYLNDYTAVGSNRLALSLLLQDMSRPDLPVRLRFHIEGQGFSLRTKDHYLPAPITLEPGIPLRLSGDELAGYLTPRNLQVVNGNEGAFLRTGKLPEGVYRFCVEVLEYNRNSVISNPACGTGWLLLNDPPLLNRPGQAEKLRAMEPQNIQFNWTPRHTGSPNSAFSTEYEFTLVEVWPANRNPNDAILSTAPIYQETTNLTSLYYGPAEPPLEPGRTYAWRVRATSSTGAEEMDLFKNEGYSEVRSFQWGEICTAPQGLEVKTYGTTRLKLSWQSTPEQSEIIVRYRLQSSEEGWEEESTYLSEHTIGSLQPETSYEVQVVGLCASVTGGTSLTVIGKTAVDQNSDFSCGADPGEFNLDNTNPLPELRQGDYIQAGDLEVRIDSVGGSNGTFSGKGVTGLPFLNLIQVRVRFNDIRVNTDYRMFDGHIATIWDPNSRSVIDMGGDDMLEENEDANSPEGEDGAPGSDEIIVSNDSTVVTGPIADSGNDDSSGSEEEGGEEPDNADGSDPTSDGGEENPDDNPGNNPDNNNPDGNNDGGGNSSGGEGVETEQFIIYRDQQYADGSIIYIENSFYDEFSIENFDETEEINWDFIDASSSSSYKNEFLTYYEGSPHVRVKFDPDFSNFKLINGHNGVSIAVDVIFVNFNITQDLIQVRPTGEDKVTFTLNLNLLEKEKYKIFVNTTAEEENFELSASEEVYEWYSKHPISGDLFSSGSKAVIFRLEDGLGNVLAEAQGEVDILPRLDFVELYATDLNPNRPMVGEATNRRQIKENGTLYVVNKSGKGVEVSTEFNGDVAHQFFWPNEPSIRKEGESASSYQSYTISSDPNYHLGTGKRKFTWSKDEKSKEWGTSPLFDLPVIEDFEVKVQAFSQNKVVGLVVLDSERRKFLSEDYKHFAGNSGGNEIPGKIKDKYAKFMEMQNKLNDASKQFNGFLKKYFDYDPKDPAHASQFTLNFSSTPNVQIWYGEKVNSPDYVRNYFLGADSKVSIEAKIDFPPPWSYSWPPADPKPYFKLGAFMKGSGELSGTAGVDIIFETVTNNSEFPDLKLSSETKVELGLGLVLGAEAKLMFISSDIASLEGGAEIGVSGKVETKVSEDYQRLEGQFKANVGKFVVPYKLIVRGYTVIEDKKEFWEGFNWESEKVIFFDLGELND